MGADRRARALSAWAFAMVLFVPTIAMAKTLEGTGGGSEPTTEPVAGPPVNGTAEPYIVPPDPSRIVETTEPEPGPETSSEPEPEGSGERGRAAPGSDGETDRGDQTLTERSSSTSVARPPAFVPALDQGRPTPLPVNRSSPSMSTDRGLVGPRLPRPPDPIARPDALALRAAITATPTGPGRVSGGPSRPTSPPVLPAGPVASPGSTSFTSCATVPSPAAQNERVRWSVNRMAEISAGRDLRSSTKVSSSIETRGADEPTSPTSPIWAYLLDPNSSAVLARFRGTISGFGGSREGAAAFDEMAITDCDGRPADGIAPGRYLVRYAIFGQAAPGTTTVPDAYLSPAFAVRAVAGPTAPRP